jgi:hypothetical protein
MQNPQHCNDATTLSRHPAGHTTAPLLLHTHLALLADLLNPFFRYSLRFILCQVPVIIGINLIKTTLGTIYGFLLADFAITIAVMLIQHMLIDFLPRVTSTRRCR